MKPRFVMIAIALSCALSSAQAQDVPKPPPAASRPVSDDYYGIQITDPYRYLENSSDPEVQKWMKSQAGVARQTLDRITGRAQILTDIEKYTNAAPASVSDVHRLAGGRYFF